MQTIVLSNSRKETYAWATAKGLRVRDVIHVQSATSISGRAYDKIVELPSFSTRRDRFAIETAIRNLQRRLRQNPLERIVEDDWVMPEPVVPVVDQPIDWLLGNVGTLPEPDEADDKAEITFLAPEGEKFEKFDKGGWLQPGKTEVTNDTGETQVVVDLAAALRSSVDAAKARREAVGDLDFTRPPAKKKGRRTNEQKAYDEALEAWTQLGDESTHQELELATEKLRQRHPDDERLTTSRPQPDTDLEF